MKKLIQCSDNDFAVFSQQNSQGMFRPYALEFVLSKADNKFTLISFNQHFLPPKLSIEDRARHLIGFLLLSARNTTDMHQVLNDFIDGTLSTPCSFYFDKKGVFDTKKHVSFARVC